MSKLLLDKNFIWWLGAFHGAWLSLETLTCYGIKVLLRITSEEAHVLTAGMEFGRKATLLRNLVHRSDLDKKTEIIGALGKLMNEGRRNMFVHGIVTTDEHSVTFIERSRGGDYTATKRTFTGDDLVAHVRWVTETAVALEEAFSVDEATMLDFAMAALSTDTKSKRSPDPPSSNA